MWAGNYSGLGGNDATYGGRGTSWLEQDIHLPRKATAAPKAANSVNWYAPDTIDLMAPGQRDMIANPSFFAQPAYRSNLYENNNRALALNWDQFEDMFTGPVAQRQQEYWWDLLHNPELECIKFRNLSQWNTAPTGFTALRFLTPHSTLKPV